MEQEGGDKSDKIYITEVKTGSLTQKTTLIFSYEKENKSSKKKEGYNSNYNYTPNNTTYNYKFYFKDENIRTLFKMLFERVLRNKIDLKNRNKIQIPLDKIDKQKMKLDTVYIEVSNFGTKDKHISSILKKNDEDYVNLKDDTFISYLTNSGLNKDAVKLIIAIYVTYYIKSSGQPPIKTNVENRDSSIKDEELSSPHNISNSGNNVNTGQVRHVPVANDTNDTKENLNNNDDLYNNNSTFVIHFSIPENEKLWNKLNDTLKIQYRTGHNSVIIEKQDLIKRNFDLITKSGIVVNPKAYTKMQPNGITQFHKNKK